MKRRSIYVFLMMLLLFLNACQKEGTDTMPEDETIAGRTEVSAATSEFTEAAEEPSVETSAPAETVTEPEEESADTDFVRVCDYIPTAQQELFYATEKNFTGHVIYDFSEAYLRYGTVKKLMAVAADLAELGLYIKIWDGFRPVSAQFKLWEICPDSTYVANPNVGYSSHSRGNTIDLTLVDENGVELEMPTGFDDFSTKADRDYSDCTEAARNNAQLLEILMEKHGFSGYWGEWWHYSDTVKYPVEEVFEP